MSKAKAALAAMIGIGGAAVAIAAAPIAAAQPSCTQINTTTTQCSTNGSTSISTSPGTIAQPVWPYPYNDPWWGPASMISGW